MSAPQTLADLGIRLKHSNRPGQHRAACPWCDRGPKDEALSVKVEPDGGATWHCHRCGEKGGIAGDSWDRPTRAAPAPRARPAPAPRAPQPERHEVLSPAGWALWRGCEPVLPGTVAARYLEGRGCALPPWPEDSDLRWRSDLRHPSGYVGPGLVALITDVETCEPNSLHRTWLARDGSRKAGLEELGEGGKARLLLARHRGAGVGRLWPDAEVSYGLVLGEGIETCLAAAHAGLAPVWSTLSAGNLAAFPVLAGLEAITILVDHDEPNPKTGLRAGEEAAAALIERYVAAGFDPERDIKLIMSPVEGEDANALVVRA